MTLPDPKYYWRFNEGRGDKAVDEVRGAEIKIGPEGWHDDGTGRTALRFISQYRGAGVVQTTLPDQPPPWTVVVWIKREADTEAAALLSSDDFIIQLEKYRNQHTVGVTRVQGPAVDLTSRYETRIGAWVHLVLVGTAKETNVYADGELQGTFAASMRLPLGWIGSRQGEIDFGTFLLDELKIYHEALTAAQVAELYKEDSKEPPKPPPQPLPKPRYYWNFDEGRGNVAIDAVARAEMKIERECWMEGKWKTGLAFASDKVGAGRVTTILPDRAPPWTASMWVKRQTDDPWATLFSSARFAVRLVQDSRNQGVGFTRFSTADLLGFDEASYYSTPLDRWVHLVIVGTESDTKVYADGKLQKTFSFPFCLPLQWVGSTRGYQEFSACVLDELKIYHEALTAAQVAQLYKVEPTANPDPVLEVRVDGEVAANGGSKDMGTLEHDESDRVQVQINNTGHSALTYSIQGTDASDAFMVPRETSKTLEPGGAETYEVSFTSSKAGRASMTLTITSDDPNAKTFTYTIHATGKDSPVPKIPALEVRIDGELRANGGSKDLGLVGHGKSYKVPVQIKNTGDGRLTYSIQGADASGAFVVPSATGKTLEPGGAQTYEVSFTSSKAGRASVKLTITSDDPKVKTFTYTLHATGEGAPAAKIPALEVEIDGEVAANGGSKDMGSLAYDQSDRVQVLIKNTGTGRLTYSIEGTDASGAFVTPSATGKTLEAGDAQMYEVSFTSSKSGRATATVVITSDDPKVKTFTYTIHATGEGEPTTEKPINTVAFVHETSSTEGSKLYRLDLNTGEATLVGPTVPELTDIAALNGNVLIGVQMGPTPRVVRIDPRNARCVVADTVKESINGLGSRQGVVYAVDASHLFKLDPGTGTTESIGGWAPSGMGSAGDIAISDDGKAYTALEGANGKYFLASVDLQTRATKVHGPIGTFKVLGMDFAEGRLFGVTYTGELLLINVVTGVGTLVAVTEPRGKWTGMACLPSPQKT